LSVALPVKRREPDMRARCFERREATNMQTIDPGKWDGYGLTTANILYGMPDHPSVLQSYVWQAYDLAPRFPELHRFLDFWRRELEGPLHSVSVAHKQLIRAGEFRVVRRELSLH
jgi:uncharacterized protein Usg